MNAKSTQRFVGFVVVAVAAILVSMALPAKQGGRRAETADQGGPVDPRTVLPVFELEDGWWVLTRYGMRLRLPEGWEPLARYDRPFAYRDSSEPVRGSFNVLSLPNFFHPDLASVAEENRKTLADSEKLELVSIEETKLGTHPALRLDYKGRQGEHELRFAAIVFLLGGHQVVVTAAAAEGEWDAVADQIRASLESIELLDLPTMDLEELLESVGRR